MMVFLFGIIPALLAAPLPVADLQRREPIDFAKEILPMLRRNCLACHAQGKAKASLVLETPATILKGSANGPVVVPGRAQESLLFQSAAHRSDPEMPPPENKVAASPLSASELGLLRLWIEQGARGEVTTGAQISWQELPERCQPIYAVAVTADGQFVACNRGNRLYIYPLVSSGNPVALTDSSLFAAKGQVAHRDAVRALAFSPTGEMLASGAYREVKLWQRAKLAPLIGLRPGDAPLPDTSARSDSNHLAAWCGAPRENELIAVTRDGVLRRWTVTPGAAPTLVLSAEIETGQCDVCCLNWDCRVPRTIVLATDDGLLQVWDLSTAQVVASMNHGSSVRTVAWRPDGRRLVSVGTDHRMRLWALPSGTPIQTLAGDRFAQERAAVCRRLYRQATNELSYQIAASTTAEKERQLQVARVRKSAEDLTAAEKAVTEKRQRATEAKATLEAAQKTARDLKGANDNAGVAAEDFTARSKAAKAALEAAEKQSQQIEAELQKADQKRATFETELSLAIAAAQRAADVLAEVERAVASAETERTRSESLAEAANRAFEESFKPVQALAFSASGQVLATLHDGGVIHTWNGETGGAIDTLSCGTAAVANLAFADEETLEGFTHEGTRMQWQLAPRWTLQRTLGTGDLESQISDRANALAFARDGQTLVVGSGEPSRSGDVQLWDLASGHLAREFRNLHSDAVLSVDLAPSGKLLASAAADRFMKVIDLEGGRVTRSFEGHLHHVLGVAWKPDGRTLATAGADAVVKFWDYKSGQRTRNVEGSGKEVTSITPFVDDGFLVTSGDGQVRIVNDKGESVRSFAGAQAFIYSAAATPDGRVVVAGGEEGKVFVWNGVTGQRLATFEATPDSH